MTAPADPKNPPSPLQTFLHAHHTALEDILGARLAAGDTRESLVLFLVGISGHFRLTPARIGLIVVAAGILVFAVILLVTAPVPP